MENEALDQFIASVEFFTAFKPEELKDLATQADARFYEFGDTVLTAGEAAQGLYIVRTGTVRLFVEDQGKEKNMGIKKAGEVIAELAALREHPLEFSVRASGKTELVFVPRAAITKVLAKNKDAEKFVTRYIAINMAGGFVTRLFDLRRQVNKEQLEDFVNSVGVKRVKADDTIIEQGDTKDKRLYVVRQGKVRIAREESGDEYSLATHGQGEVFGEAACLQGKEQSARAVAETDVVLLVLPESTVNAILDKNPKVRAILEKRIEFSDRELQRQKKLAERRKRPILLDLWSRPKRGERLIKRFPLVEQAEESDCGAACLAMLCKHYNIPLTLGKLREMANVTTEGATLESLAQVGESLGFTSRGVKCTYQVMLGFDLPLIAHWEGFHYIIVYGISKSHVWVADPARGFLKMSREEFEKGWTGTCLLFTPGSDMVELKAQRSPWARFVKLISPYKNVLGHLIMATFVVEILGIAPPLIVQNILDRVVVHQDFQLLNLLIIGLMLSQVFTQLTTMMRGFLSNYLVRNLDFSMMSMFFKHTLALPIAFFAKRRTGDIFARFQENQKIREFLTESTISTLLNVLMVFIYFVVLFMYNVKMTLLLVALVIPIAVLTVVVTPKIKNYARREFETSTEAEAVLMETLSGAETVKAMGIERSMRMKWEKKYANALDVQYRAGRFDILVGVVGQLMNAATGAIILWVGANLVLSQELTIGQLMAFNMLMGSIMSPLMGLIGLWDELHETGVSMERLGDVLDLDPEQKAEDISSRVVLPDLQGNIRLENAYFRYGGGETPYVLQNISCEIKAGEFVAIVGQSGSGKSTLAKLLVGFYPPTEGSIYVDDYDLNIVDKEYYRAQIGYVLQNNLLFSGTITENIALGDDNPDKQRIIEVAKLADAHGFIGNMPLGYEQTVGERGMGLSGGQMQRICIARALYHDPRLLIFDEATSALDTQSESNVLQSMRDILKGRTAVVIAHRLSTVMSADKILVLYNGSIVEEGKHQDLVDQKGMYYQLVHKQISQAA